jgi:hypothetical protein
VCRSSVTVLCCCLRRCCDRLLDARDDAVAAQGNSRNAAAPASSWRRSGMQVLPFKSWLWRAVWSRTRSSCSSTGARIILHVITAFHNSFDTAPHLWRLARRHV